MASTTQYISKFKTLKPIANLPDGSYAVRFLSFTGSDEFDVKLVNFVDGQCDIDIEAPPGKEVVGQIITGGFPSTDAALFPVKTTPIVYANDTLTDRLTLDGSEVNQINGSNYTTGRVLTLPSGATLCIYSFEGADGCISYNPRGAFDYLNPDETITEAVSYRTTDGEIGQFTIEVRGSQEVGEDLLRGFDSYSAAGWVESNGSYTHSTGTDPLETGNVPLENESVYEVAFSVAGMTAGSVKPQLVGSTTETSNYSLSINGREVWYLKATASLCNLQIVPSADFDGVIDTSTLFMKKLDTNSGVSSFRESSIDTVGFNEAKFKFRFNEFYRWSSDNAYDYFIDNPNLGRDKEFHDTFWFDNAGVENVVLDGMSLSGFHSIVARNAPSATRGGVVKGFLEAYELDMEGGYNAASADNQAFYSLGVNGVACGKYSLYHQDMDLLRSPNLNNHSNDNSDCVRINGGCEAPVSDDFITGFNIYAANAGDGCLDAKTTSEWNFAEFYGSNREIRMHRSHALFVNSNLERAADTASAIDIEHPYSVLQMHNCSLEGERMVSYEQVQENVATLPGFGEGNAPIYSWENYVDPADAHLLFHVMKTMPRQRDMSKAAITDIQIQAADTGTTNWTDIYSNGIPSGHFLTVSLNAGNYDIRARIRNGANATDWVDLGTAVRIYDLIPLTFPSEFDWFTTSYTINSNSTTDFDIDDFKPTPTNDVYLSATGNDSNDGLTVGTAKATLASALSVSGVDRVLVSDGDYADCAIDASATLSGNLIIEATGDNVNLYGGTNTATWSAEGTYTNVYQASIAAVAGVLDLTDIDEWNGKAKSLISVNSLAALDSATTGYYHNSGMLYVKLHDGRAPDSSVFVSELDSIKGHPSSALFIEGVSMYGFGVDVASSASAGNIIAVKDSESIASASRGVYVQRNGVQAYLSSYNIYNAALHGITVANDTKCLEYNCIIDGCDGSGSIRFNSGSVIRIGGNYTNSRLSQIDEKGSTSSINIGLGVTSSDAGADNAFDIGSGVTTVYVLNCTGIDTTKWDGSPAILGSSGKVLEQNNTDIDVRSAVFADLY